MKVTKIKIKNFRGYKDDHIVEINDLSVFVGKNDVGKSTILEALDIFFNDKDAIIKLDKNDLNKSVSGNEQISISVSFSEYPKKIDIDAGNQTSLEDEYLLNLDNELEIKKIFENGKVTEVIAVANHPTNGFSRNLLEKKIKELQDIVEQNKFECDDKTKNAELRRAIRDNYDDLNLQTQEIQLKKEDAKKVWEKLESYMPMYALFQSDRSNNDQDSEVQNPMKLAVKEILKDNDLQEKFKEIATVVEEKIKNIANKTLEKLNEMNSDIAEELKPVIPSYETLKWTDVFKKIDISSDNDIPLNKRGSGVKRLVLLNFFRAEADRRKEEDDVTNIIYAIEEPETSQHPDHQKILIKSFKSLSQTGNTQILLTTHSPAIVKMMDLKDLNIIRKGGDSAITIEKAQTLQLPYPSLNEINYIAFDYISEEYHNELYAYLETEKQQKFRSHINNHGTQGEDGFRKYINNHNNRTEYITLHKYIRHQIHHPENNSNIKYAEQDLRESIEYMRNLL